jgi:uncharacterized protein YkwD
MSLLLVAACGSDDTPGPSGDPAPGGVDAGASGTVDAAPTPPRPDAAPALPADAQTLFDAINLARTAAGRPVVAVNPTLVCAAAAHASDIGAAMTCGVAGSDGTTFEQRVTTCGGSGFRQVLVNCGNETAQSVVDTWLEKEPERLLDATWEQVGVAMSNDHWVIAFDD